MRCFSLIVCATLAAAVGGCLAAEKEPSDPKSQPRALTNDFDNAKEPAIGAQTRFAAGQLAESQQNPIVAMKQYEAAIKLQPDHLQSLYRLGVVAAQLKQFPKASQTWQRYIKASNGSADGFANLGFTEELAGNFEQAKKAYEKGIERDPKNQPCRVNYGLMLARQERMTDAISQLRTVLTPAQVSYNIGSVYEQQGHKEQAKAEYRRALELDSKLMDAKTRLAAIQ